MAAALLFAALVGGASTEASDFEWYNLAWILIGQAFFFALLEKRNKESFIKRLTSQRSLDTVMHMMNSMDTGVGVAWANGQMLF